MRELRARIRGGGEYSDVARISHDLRAKSLVIESRVYGVAEASSLQSPYYVDGLLSQTLVLEETDQTIHVDLLFGDGFAQALHIGDLVDGVHFADFDRIHIRKPELVQALACQAHVDPLIRQKFLSA